MSTRYLLRGFKVVSVEERKETHNYRVDPVTKETLYDERSLGWFVRFENCSSLGPFPSKPDFEKGVMLKSTWEVDNG